MLTIYAVLACSDFKNIYVLTNGNTNTWCSNINDANLVTKAVLSFTLNGLGNNTSLSISITNTARQLVKTSYMGSVQNYTAYAIGLTDHRVYYLQLPSPTAKDLYERL